MVFSASNAFSVSSHNAFFNSITNWVVGPGGFVGAGVSAVETVFDARKRRALTDQARFAYDQSVDNYRQTVLTAFQEVEDNLAALRILEEEAAVQQEAVALARQALQLTLNQYKAGPSRENPIDPFRNGPALIGRDHVFHPDTVSSALAYIIIFP